MLLKFIIFIVRNQVNYQALPWLSLFVYFFIFILLSNYIGLLPFGFTLTSHFVYVLLPTYSIFVGLTIRIVTDNLVEFVAHFVPKEVPKLIAILLFITEVISYIFRSISLPVRIFANMVAGHVLLFLIALALVSFIEFPKGLLNKMLIPVIILIWIAVFGLELLVAFLQAYVFLTMISIYAKDTGFVMSIRNRSRRRYATSKSITNLIFWGIIYYCRLNGLKLEKILYPLSTLNIINTFFIYKQRFIVNTFGIA